MSTAPDFQDELGASVFDNEHWYGDGPPLLPDTFNARATNFRRCETVLLLRRDARQAFRRGDDPLGRQFKSLADKLTNCKPNQRCGSLGCLKCLRALQKAKTAASQACLSKLAQHQKSKKTLVMVTCIPTWMRYRPTDLSAVVLADCNTWLLRRLKEEGFSRPMLGSVDVSWEKGFYQVHWHFATWTSNRVRLKERLKAIFPSEEQYGRPVLVKKARDLGFLTYTHKCIKVVDLLRRNRRGISHLLTMFDRTNPMDVMMLTRMHMGFRDGKLFIERGA